MYHCLKRDYGSNFRTIKDIVNLILKKCNVDKRDSGIDSYPLSTIWLRRQTIILNQISNRLNDLMNLKHPYFVKGIVLKSSVDSFLIQKLQLDCEYAIFQMYVHNIQKENVFITDALKSC